MTLNELLTDLRQKNIELWVEGDRLRYRGATGVLTPTLLAELNSHKAEVMEFLRAATRETRSAKPPIQSVARTGNLPLSFAQQRLWLLDQLEPNSAVYNVPSALQLQGSLDTPALERALSEIIRRHEALRTTFPATEEGQPIQVITPPQPVRLAVVDLRELPADERQKQAERLKVEEVRRPFNLATGPLVRSQLLRLAEQEYVLLLNMHHIVSDGWSCAVFARELSELYKAFSAGQPSPLPELTIQYVDFACWQRQWLQGEVLESQLTYWKRQLTGSSYVLELPADHPRPTTTSYRGASLTVEFPRALADALKELSRREGATLFMTLLAAFQTLMYRYSGQEDLIVGSVSAGRDRVETEGLIGFFINTLVLRNDFSGNPTFLTVLQRAREAALGAFAHQDLPFEKLVEELHLARDMSRAPLCQVMLVLQNAPVPSVQLPQLAVTPLTVDLGAAKFDLMLELEETPGGISGLLGYCTDLFDEPRMRRLIGHFQTLLEGIVAHPDEHVRALPLLTRVERQQLLAEGNKTGREQRPPVCIHQLFEAQAQRTPDAVAVTFEKEQLTYRQLNERANQLAHHLRGRGVGPDTLVGMCVDRSLEMVVGILGILKAGGAYVPLDLAYPKDRLAFMLGDAAVPVLLTQKNLLPNLPSLEGERPVAILSLDADWELIARESTSNPDSGAAAENLAYVIYTSGSTGKPKGVLVTHDNVVRLFTETDAWYHFGAQDVWTLFHSYAFDFSVWELWGALLYGGRLVVVPYLVSRSPEAFLELLSRERVTVLNQTPSAFRQLIWAEANGKTKRALSLRYVIFGGEALELQSLKPWYERHGDRQPQLINMYGITETTVHVTYRPIALGDLEANRGSVIGEAIPDLQVYILGENLEPVPEGTVGEMYVGGAGLARGYLNRPELTAQRFIKNPFRPGTEQRLYKTGDLARRLPDGDLEYLGRSDDQVKIRGFRIELGEIISVLDRHPAVRESVVIAAAGSSGDKQLNAYLVSRGPAPSVSDLRSYLKQQLPDYMVPSAFVFLEKLPLTPNGKVDRRALPAPDQQRGEQDRDFLAPRDPLEQQLAKLWEKIFGFAPIGVRNNFFELGGHSLLAVRLFAQIEKITGKRLPLVTLFQAPTIEQLANILKKEGWEPSWWCLVPIKADGSRPPFYCIHGVGGNILEYLDLAKYMDADQPFYGIQAIGLDGKRPRQNLTVEDMAAHYIKEIRAFQATGPYYFGGSSFGGAVAYEMAQQLTAQGEQVGLMALFDTNGPGYPVYLPSTTVWQKRFDAIRHRVTLHWENLMASRGSDRLKYVRVKAKKWSYGFVVGSQRQVRRKWRKFLDRMDRFFWPEAIRRVNRAGHWAAADYKPKPYVGRATLFRATEQPRHIIEDRYLGWEPMVKGGVEVYDTPGHHGAIVRDPRAKVLARQLQEALNKSREQLAAQAGGSESKTALPAANRAARQPQPKSPETAASAPLAPAEPALNR